MLSTEVPRKLVEDGAINPGMVSASPKTYADSLMGFPAATFPRVERFLQCTQKDRDYHLSPRVCRSFNILYISRQEFPGIVQKSTPCIPRYAAMDRCGHLPSSCVF